EPDTVWSSFPTPNDPDIAEIGKVKEGDRWWGKEHVEEIFLTSLRARVPQYDFPPPADAEELHEAHDAAQAAIGTSLPPPPVARPSAGWEDELRVNTVDPEEDARVERNKRRLMEEGDGA
ncbi:MAG: hypothetical protein GWO24_05675, partial [Akkermansiaceae bacterium]|nr:hypothetical protein [Akkermansiaceae bacterium]